MTPQPQTPDQLRAELERVLGLLEGVSWKGQLNEERGASGKLRALEVSVEDKTLALIAQAPADGWVSVGERLPEEGKWVLVYVIDLHIDEFGFMAISCLCGGAWMNMHGGDWPTHWQPLPAPPEAQQ